MENAFSAVQLLRSRDQRNLTCVPNCLPYVKRFSYFGIAKFAELAKLVKLAKIARTQLTKISGITGISEFSEKSQNPVSRISKRQPKDSER